MKKRKQLSLWEDVDVFMDLSILAFTHGVTVSEMIRLIIRNAIRDARPKIDSVKLAVTITDQEADERSKP